MKAPQFPFPHVLQPKHSSFTSYRSCIWLTILGLLLFGSGAYGQTNHPPVISWLPDQRTLPGGTFTKQYFRAWDNETQLTASNITMASTNPSFTNPIGITWGICNTDDIVNHGCAPDGGWWIAFPGTLGTPDDPSATVTLTVTDGGNPAKPG
jgi:hypothetical protein